MRGKNGRSSSSSDFNVKLDWPRSRSSRRLVYIVLYEILEEACCMACTRCFDPRDSVETVWKNPGQPGRSLLIVRSLLNCDYYLRNECKDLRGGWNCDGWISVSVLYWRMMYLRFCCCCCC